MLMCEMIFLIAKILMMDTIHTIGCQADIVFIIMKNICCVHNFPSFYYDSVVNMSLLILNYNLSYAS